MSQTRTRKRHYLTQSENGVSRTYSFGVLLSQGTTLVQDGVLQKTTSQGNPFRSETRKKHYSGKYDLKRIPDWGGSFLTQKVSITSYPGGSFHLIGTAIGNAKYTYDGPAHAYYENLELVEAFFIAPSSNAVLDAAGTTAIARCLPTNPLSGMGQFLGELRSLPTALDLQKWRSKVHNIARHPRNANLGANAKDVSNEWLNLQFGWLPFLSDLAKFAKAVRKAAPMMEKYARESGRLIHRQYHFPEETTTTVRYDVGNKFPNPALNIYLWTQGGKRTSTTVRTTKRWFKGAFTYHLPIPGGESYRNEFVSRVRHFEAQANKLFGLRLSLDLLWKLTPWSWAVGWVSNANDIIHNWSAFQNDGLVMHYGYIMEHIIQTETITLTGVKTKQGSHNFSQEIVVETKSRRRATPYGFGVNPASFTTKQWSIIAALGISRSPQSLNF